MAAFPLYMLARSATNHRFFSFTLVLSYLFFIGTQFAILNEFHQITFAPLFIILLYYALHMNNPKLYWFSILALLITKEDLSLLVGAIGIGLLFFKQYKKLGLATAILGLCMFFFLIYIFMPAISFKGVYDHFHFGPIGKTPLEIIFNLMKNPGLFAYTMINPHIKLQTLFRSFFTFSLLPLFAPLPYLIPLIEDFSDRFIYSGPQYTKWGLVNHHAATGAMLLAITSVYAVLKLSKLFKTSESKKRFYILVGIILISTTTLNNLVFHGPINSLFKRQFYEEEKWVIDNREVIAQVPKSVSVAAQNNLLPHMTHRDDIYRLPFGLNSEYMVVDLHNGANDYAYAPMNF